jgi:periplasmic divalent cation tolerance protein
MKYVIIYTTVSDKLEGENLSEILVSEKLAACVNMFPVISTYRFRGEVRKDEEFGMFIKTREDLVDEAIERIRQLHSYELPCIISIPIKKGYEKYLKWIGESTK